MGRSVPWSEVGRFARQMHDGSVRAEAGRLFLAGAGVNAIARKLRVPRTTVSYWIGNRKEWSFDMREESK